MKVFSYKKDVTDVSALISRSKVDVSAASGVASGILNDMKARGDAALFEYTKKFDNVNLTSKNVRVSPEEISAAARRVNPELLRALRHARNNISKFHSRQLKNINRRWSIAIEQGVEVGEKILPIDSAGCYVPGGRASYPSTVLMTSIPAKVAGVKRVVVASPPEIPDSILAACHVCNVDEVYRMGGAQAIAALAYGTKSVKPVSKIVGPGNKYVLAAKNLVYGTVDIDMPAGPSEVLIIADDTTNPDYAAADLLAQAEHDPDAQCVIVSNSRALLDSVSIELERRKKGESRPVSGNIHGVLVKTMAEAVEFANEYAAEHLEIMARNAASIEKKITNAGAIFIGPYAPVPLGDYASGANHVLPTGGAAKFASPLSVRDFLKACSVQNISKAGLKKLGTTAMTLAQAEGLLRHRKSIEERFP
ncbi:MAG: histidinol dehydrogenase [Candidatus Altiarchaeota archaeon]|nr:histidinol dehydrogenase [Candidatus Altiarchaeota archaeon]